MLLNNYMNASNKLKDGLFSTSAWSPDQNQEEAECTSSLLSLPPTLSQTSLESC